MADEEEVGVVPVPLAATTPRKLVHVRKSQVCCWFGLLANGDAVGMVPVVVYGAVISTDSTGVRRTVELVGMSAHNNSVDTWVCKNQVA